MNIAARPALSVGVPVLFFLCVAALTLQQQSIIWFPLDDAYITIGNVELYLSGQQDLFGNDAPTGATSLMHFLAMAVLSQVIETPVASLVLGISSAALYAIGLWLLLFAISSARIIAASGTIAGIMLGYAWFHFVNGLETGMAMAAITWAFYFRHTGKFTALAILIGILPFIRPEFYVLSALLFISVALVRPRNLKAHLVFLSLSVAVYALLAIVSFAALGGIFPDTAGAKEAFFAEKGTEFFNRAATALSAVWRNDLLLVFAGLVFAPLIRGGWVALVFLGVVVLSAALKLPGALFHNNFRYLYPFLPLAIVAWAAVLANRKRADLIFVFAAAVSVAFFATRYWPIYAGFWKSEDDARLRVTEWTADTIPSGSVIGIHDAGFMPWHLANTAETKGFHLVDLVGLKSPEAIAFHEEFTDPTNGAERWRALDEIGQSHGVEYLIILDKPFWGNLQAEFEFAGWELDLIYPNKGSYQVFQVISR